MLPRDKKLVHLGTLEKCRKVTRTAGKDKKIWEVGSSDSPIPLKTIPARKLLFCQYTMQRRWNHNESSNCQCSILFIQQIKKPKTCIALWLSTPDIWEHLRNIELPLPALSSPASRPLFSLVHVPIPPNFSGESPLATIYRLYVCFHELKHALSHVKIDVKIEIKYKECVRTGFGHY